MLALEEFLKDNREKAYSFAKRNTTYNAQNRPTISKDDEWANEKEWDNMFSQMKKRKAEE